MRIKTFTYRLLRVQGMKQCFFSLLHKTINNIRRASSQPSTDPVPSEEKKNFSDGLRCVQYSSHFPFFPQRGYKIFFHVFYSMMHNFTEQWIIIHHELCVERELCQKNSYNNEVTLTSTGLIVYYNAEKNSLTAGEKWILIQNGDFQRSKLQWWNHTKGGEKRSAN